MTSEGSSRNQLPDSIKLKGEENYIVQKDTIKDLAIINNLYRFIYKKGRALEYINEFNKKADIDKLKLQKAQASRDLSIKLIIQLNIKKTPVQILVGYKIAREIQVILQT